MSMQEIAALIESVNNMTATVAQKTAEIDQKIDTGIANIENQFINIEGMHYKRVRIPWVYPASGPEGSYAHNTQAGAASAAILLYPNDTGNITELKHVSGTIVLSRGGLGSGGSVGYGDFVAHRGYLQFNGIMNNAFGEYTPYLTNKFVYEGKEWVAILLKPALIGGAPDDGVYFDVRCKFPKESDDDNLFKLINPIDERLYADVFNP
ncbi:hypothetical protein [Shewanella xiamenensis]|uniref:hypothetical protein n=1 Tax=Shewanella xiamenensis TaxID=332186 RepID=UPI002E7BDC57|nr:hypothetical protein [Shewanella xiamenensis]